VQPKTQPRSITDLQRFDVSNPVSRHQLWAALVEAWAVDRDLADWIVARLTAENAALRAAKKQVAALEDELEATNPTYR
jgi:hypothetical protein